MTEEATVQVADDVFLAEITARAEAFAAERGYAFSRVKDRILKELVKMRNLCGEFYCPCVPENTAATVCVCEEVRSGGYVEQWESATAIYL
jgi:hypothetical protein